MGNESVKSPLSKYEIGDDLGEGAQGIVWKATLKKTGEAFAVKQCYVEGSAKRRESFTEEANIM